MCDSNEKQFNIRTYQFEFNSYHVIFWEKFQQSNVVRFIKVAQTLKI
jgi:hypothetical protein